MLEMSILGKEQDSDQDRPRISIKTVISVKQEHEKQKEIKVRQNNKVMWLESTKGSGEGLLGEAL